MEPSTAGSALDDRRSRWRSAWQCSFRCWCRSRSPHRPTRRYRARARSGQPQLPQATQQRRTPRPSKWAPSSARTSSGFVTGVRFYKGSGNTGTHIGHLWTAAGANLGTVTFTGETATGWQQANFAAPVAITANTTYVVSYYAPVGRYAADAGGFATQGVDNAPLHALANGVDGANGVYRYGTGGGFPTNTYQSTNYWVDVVFNTSAADTTPPTVTANSPAANATGVPTTTTVTATFSEPIQAGTAALALDRRRHAVAGIDVVRRDEPHRDVDPDRRPRVDYRHTATVTGAKDPARQHDGRDLLVVHDRRRPPAAPARSGPTHPRRATVTVQRQLRRRTRRQVPIHHPRVHHRSRFYKGRTTPERTWARSGRAAASRCRR